MASLLELTAAFDDSAYLAANPDVAASTRENPFQTGWSHYLRHGFAETRAGSTAELATAIQRVTESGDAEPLPPMHLRNRVGNRDGNSFNPVGRVIALEFLRATATHLPTLQPGARVLDFGCGCGRVLRYLRPALPKCEFVGSDIDAEAIAWNSAHLTQLGRFMVNGHWPALELEDESVDLVYAASVFTHLPEDMQFAWLAELRRVTRKGGLLLLTVLGLNQFHVLWRKYNSLRALSWLWQYPAKLIRTPSEPAFGTLASLRKHWRHGFSFVQYGQTPGLPSFYQIAFHNPRYIRDHWSKELEILAFQEQALGIQDLVVCRRPA